MDEAKHHHHKKRHPLETDADFLRRQFAQSPAPTGPTAESYRIIGYTNGLIAGKKPECDLLRPHYDSGLKWPDPNNPKPDDMRWGGGVRAGVTWDGTFYRDLARYPAGGAFFWSAYLKPGTSPGNGNGFWLNFGSGWAHLANDDFSQMLTGASQRLFWEPGVAAPAPGASGGAAGTAATTTGNWKLVIEATMFVTNATVNVWTGTKAPIGAFQGNDPVGTYTRTAGCDPTSTFSVEA